MTQPAVTITEIDNALGVLPDSEGALLALIGTSSSGPLNMPATYGRTKSLQADFGAGDLVEAGARSIELYGRPIVVIRCAAATPGAIGTLTFTGTGTSVITADVTAAPAQAYNVKVTFVGPGTVGTAGITYRYTIDGGRNVSALQSLGAATTLTIPGTGIVLALAAGTIVANDAVTFTTSAPTADVAGITAAIDALALSVVNWRICFIVPPVIQNVALAIDQKFVGLQANHKPRMYIANARLPTTGETEAAYLAALSSEWGLFATTFGSICAGAATIASSIDGKIYTRPASYAVAPLQNIVSEEVDIADVNLGALPGVALRDANGNPVQGLHDETLFPGLDDARFTVLRTWIGVQGIYVNRPRIMSASGSDFYLIPHRLIINIAEDVIYQFLLRRVNQGIVLDKKTGYILKSEAMELNAGGTNALRSALMPVPKVSDAYFEVQRNDNILSTKTIHGRVRVLPLGYVEYFDVEIGFVNPALQVVLTASA
jgi:hypothetical protein